MDLESLTDHITVVAEDYARLDASVWRAVAQCVDARETLQMRYERFDGTIKDYTINPYHLLAYHGDWYVLAWHAGRSRVVTFALSRIQSAARTGNVFERDPSFDIEAHIQSSFGVNRGDDVFKVRLLFSRSVAAYIKARVWHPGQVIRERRHGDVELQFETAGWKELVRWVLSWQPDCKVLAPVRLRERIRQKMEKGLEGAAAPAREKRPGGR